MRPPSTRHLSLGWATRFLDDVERAIELVGESPRIGASAGRGFRKTILRRFPLSIIYVDRDEEIVIVAVAHHRRRPGFWRGRQ